MSRKWKHRVLPVFSKWLLSRLAPEPASAWARADTSVPRKFTVRCNLNVRGDRVINVTTQTWMLSPFFLRCVKKKRRETSQTHRDLVVFFLLPVRSSLRTGRPKQILGRCSDVWHDLSALISASVIVHISWKKFKEVIAAWSTEQQRFCGKTGYIISEKSPMCRHRLCGKKSAFGDSKGCA